MKEATSLHPLSQTDINTVTADNFDPVKYLAANEASYAITSHEYYADSYVSGIAGLIRATTDPEGNVTEYDYYKDGYGKGLVKSKTLKDGNTIVSTVTYEYNAQLQVSKETTSYDLSQNLYSVKEYEYDKFNNVTVTRDYGTGSTPATTIAEYDLLSRKTAEYAPNYSADKSHGSLTIYYPDGNKKSETDAEGNITSYVYDAYGQVIKKTNPDGTMNLTAYDGLQREKATYFLGSENGTKQILTKTSYEFAGYNFDIYSALDASASHSCKGLKTTKTTYITENKQVISEMLTDIKEHTIYEKTNGETKRTSAYYANGQLARQTDALGNITKYEYGYLNKVTKTYTPFNTKSDGSVNYSVTENQYDKNGNVTLAKQTVQKQDSDTVKYSVTENQYNAQGLLTQVTLSDGTSNGEKNITKYFYNNASIQTKMYTGLNSTNDSDYMTTNYEYDAWGHLVRTTDSTGYNSGATTYDLNGNVLTSTDANGNVTTNTYDALNRVLTANTVCSDTSKNVSKSYVYDNMGRVRSKTANGVQTSYQYDIFGRVYQELSPKSFKGYFYEGISQYAKEQLVGINHQTMYSSTQYEYDAEMRIAQVKESGNLTATYTYDANGNKVSETLANGVVSTYSYNGCNKVTKLVTKSGNSDISSYEYSYYLDGSDACKVRNENGIIETTSYDYDGLKRLTRESISNGKTADTYSYEYDDYGNRSKMVANGSEEYETVYDYTVNGKYTALLQKEIKTVEETSNATISDGLAISPTDLITSTAADAKTEETAYSYDANGNQITKTAESKTETNTYDGLNQLIGFTDGETTASYKYNADGLRTSKTVDGKTINHIWDGNKQIVVDMDDSDWYSAEVYVRGTNLLAKFSKQSGNVKTDYQYYTQNAHGDVVNLTDADGAVTKSYTYDAFGVEQNIDDADTNAFRYCGEYYDAETGTIYLRARYYSPTTGRFISRDTFVGRKEDPLSLNKYTYCANNPVIFTDPQGLDYYYYYGEDQAKAAAINIEELEAFGQTVHPYLITSESGFTNNWNEMNTTEEDSIIINMHGSPNSVSNINLDDINSKNADYVYLLSCSAGDQYTSNNFAERFYNANSFSCMVACDGTHFRGIQQRKTTGIFALIRKQLGIPDEYVNLSVRRKLPDEFIGPPTPSKGFVTYSKNSSGSVEVKSIGNSFKGVSALIAATRRSRKDE